MEISTCHVAAQDGVAGDFHLVTEGAHGCTVIVIGDVAGKGIAAARRAAYLRTALATFAPYEGDPRRLLQLGNRSLLDAAGVVDMFVTAVCVVIPPGGRRISWASAGHPSPIHLFSGLPFAGRPCPPLGLTSNLESARHDVELEPGAGFLLYTDGLTEARPGDGAAFSLLGDEPVRDFVRSVGDNTGAEEVANGLRSLVEEHSAGRLADDLCMVAVRVKPEAAAISSSGSPFPDAADAQ